MDVAAQCDRTTPEMFFNAETSFLTFESDPSELSLLEACDTMRRHTGYLPQAVLVGVSWWSMFCKLLDGSERPGLKFLVGGASVSVVPDASQVSCGVTLVPKRIGAAVLPQNISRIGD